MVDSVCSKLPAPFLIRLRIWIKHVATHQLIIMLGASKNRFTE
jgi:hypothetical protein